MGYSLENTTTPRQQTSKIVREKILSTQERKVEIPFAQPYLNRHHELRQSASDGLVVQLKSSGNPQKLQFGRETKKDDELVKHMSNLPGYLQRVERGENLQEKALNFGVLDWERLEKWKSNTKHIPARGNTRASSSRISSSFVASTSSSPSGTTQSKTLAPRRRPPLSHGSHLNLSLEEKLPQGVEHSRGKIIQLQDSETGPRRSFDGHQNLHSRGRSSGRNYSEIKKLDRGKSKESTQKAKSEKESSSSDQREDAFSLSSCDIMSAQDDEIKTRVEEEFNLSHQHCLAEQQSIVLLLPKHSPSKKMPESFQHSESRTSFDRELKCNGNRLSDCFFNEELHPGELYSEVPHSCPLPVSVATNAESDMKPFSSNTTQVMKLQSDGFCTRPYSSEIPAMPFEGKCLEEKKSDIEPSTATETSKRLDQDIAEQPPASGRHPSPNWRFSFSLGRMGRSLSFKDSSAVPQLSSTYVTVKSGPVRSEASADLDNFGGDEENASRRGRSSPLRRLLDPLLKPKGTHSTETVQPLKGNLNTVSFKPMNTSDLFQVKKHKASTTQALLQLTIKNGLPLFKLVVDNSNDILAAAVKKLPTPGKDDSSLIYAFYSVHEIKKKSGGWINHGSKVKGCGFGYNIVGQMHVSSYVPDLIGQNSKDRCVVRESVLYAVDHGQADKDIPLFMPNKELAAVVVKSPSEKNDNGEQSDKDKDSCFTQEGSKECLPECTCVSGENKNYNSTIVILPGGIHGMPNKGVPSPLICRWRSGGSCDCGGWDIGCRLRILTNQDQSSKVLKPSLSCSASDHFDLFVQGGGKENKPIFSLAALKNGLCSVEFNSSISLLQAFSICVAVTSSQKSSDNLDVNNPSEAKHFPEPMTGNDKMRTPTTVLGEVPAKYVPSPPPSPVGRV